LTAADQRFRKQLKQQITFIERSCAAYDESNQDEATRIATVVRILIHNTARSMSLLSHLKSRDIQLLSTSMDIVAHFDNHDWFKKGELPMFFDGMNMLANGKHHPKLGDGGVKEFRPVESWWLQPVIILERHPYTRRDIVLNVADKDGGAHVDAALTPEYENLIAAGSLGELVELTDAGVTVTPIPDAHFSALRQIGFELLNSEQLLNLAATIDP
jgi:hypothetical protein